MNSFGTLKKEEQINLDIRRLYELYGYEKYRMNKFEEYSFYLQNKNFLENDRYITFNDPDGRLMALKPDVTLSIVKNADCKGTERIYYSESIFRTRKGTNEFAELKQTGLEYIGSIDKCATAEVLSLALDTLNILSPDFVLSVSHMGVINAMLQGIESYSLRRGIISCIKGKNRHELERLCRDAALDDALTRRLVGLAGIRGPFGEGVAALEKTVDDPQGDMALALKELKEINNVFKDTEYYTRLQLDFSDLSSTEYYNGIVLSGFIQGVSSAVLSGGRYDHLLSRMGKNAQAMGFAVNFCHMEQMLRSPQQSQCTDIIYDDATDAAYMCSLMRELTAKGIRVRAVRKGEETGDGIDITGSRRYQG
ncbi:MAG: ATP phosphoribosyltransferase regulatory subunit [Clostridia bacterium]|nr:ATP phosphoribosyltransferase regulatory subunit [Clostridia bacterium]